MTRGAGSLGRGITRNVVALALVSLLTDVSSEMLVYLVPLFLANVLAASAEIIGLIEGVAESASALLRLASGAISDRIGRRRLLVGLGYGSSNGGQGLLPARQRLAGGPRGASRRPTGQGHPHGAARCADRRFDRSGLPWSCLRLSPRDGHARGVLRRVDRLRGGWCDRSQSDDSRPPDIRPAGRVGAHPRRPGRSGHRCGRPRCAARAGA